MHFSSHNNIAIWPNYYAIKGGRSISGGLIVITQEVFSSVFAIRGKFISAVEGGKFWPTNYKILFLGAQVTFLCGGGI